MPGFEVQCDPVDINYLAQVQCKEDRLKFIFGPLEKYIYFLESVLTWEYPIVFILLLAVTNFLFWIYSITPFYCLISIAGFTALSVQFLVSYVFPLFAETDASEEWVKVRNADENNLDLLHCFAVVITRFENVYKLLEYHKRDNRDRFNLLGILTCTFLLLSGCIIDESYLVYCLVMGTLLWPGMKYNKINDRIYNKARPYLDLFEQKMRIRRTISTRNEGDGEDSDAELQQFIPTKEVNEFFSPVSVDNGDESDTNDDFMPHVAGTESADVTDDELLSEELSLTARDKGAALQKIEYIESSSSESEAESIRVGLDQLPGLEISEDVVRGRGDSAVESFARGLSFDEALDDGDDDDVKGPVAEGAGQKTAPGFVGKSYARLVSIYQAVNAYVPDSFRLPSRSRESKKDERDNDDAKAIDDEFDFLNQELEDVNEY